MSFNLPPGCSVSDIPGNRSIDVWYDNFCDKCPEKDCPVDYEYGICPHNIDAAYEERGFEEDL